MQEEGQEVMSTDAIPDLTLTKQERTGTRGRVRVAKNRLQSC